MQFENQHTVCENFGKIGGRIVSFLMFTLIAFFILGKTGKMCWSLKNYAYFAMSVGIIIFLLDNFSRRLGGREKNKIIS